MAVVDSSSKFVLIDVVAEGCQSDSGVFKNAEIGKALTKGQLDIPSLGQLPGTTKVAPYAFVGDEAGDAADRSDSAAVSSDPGADSRDPSDDDDSGNNGEHSIDTRGARYNHKDVRLATLEISLSLSIAVGIADAVSEGPDGGSCETAAFDWLLPMTQLPAHGKISSTADLAERDSLRLERRLRPSRGSA
ncbi:hypothetical protein HPB48_022855 [Haemaphysalis longicornis]|uniref:Uncharacterized protein n=1 Tax=Haemaphysalis longicornis TaxID=44386 RepID=A0A9J6GKE1_HAELO|nr:hypothetical protein HPB48_022855 [Haemaphysalis longicornis]